MDRQIVEEAKNKAKGVKMTKYIVRWLDQGEPVEVEAATYRTYPASYERQGVTFYDKNGKPVKSISDVNRLRVEVKPG